ncbi:hypothetical protein PAMC26577_02595 [Caballeronia sordidicola]|uniref:Uncharacterized protein n=1 Tax=Caballeronia sordidicola TaxID=196367 RepID=A0A242N5X8_CABSO|nr:hypothetical protein PAMC26577_02595 [Caballeronia sordidicola]
MPRGAQVNRIGMASRQNRLKIPRLKASAFQLMGRLYVDDSTTR